MTTIEINGKKIEAATGSMIIEVTDQVGIQVPRFCYHKKLSIAANCRMCLVDVEKSPKPLPACATPVTEGMKIWTRSPKALLAQKAVMEFLLINHPLDCPICDQGGECELQDLSMGYGSDVSRFTEGKRSVHDQNIGPLIATDMTRCIQCTRCVRFGTEVAGLREMGALGRGEHMEIGTFVEKSVVSEVSGNIIDLCPVGALTSKPYRFTARGFELIQKPSIAPHDAVGSNIFVHIRRNDIMRVVPRENESINEVWLSDRDRFSYEALNSADRLQQPKIKRNGRWYAASWSDALEETKKLLLNIIASDGAESLGALVSPNATVEEAYLLQKWLRGLGSNNIDHRLRQSDFRNQSAMPLFPGLNSPISAIENHSHILLVGSDIRKEQPIIGLKCRKMVLSGGKAHVINPIDFAFNFDVDQKMIVQNGELVLGVAGLLKAIIQQIENNSDPSLSNLSNPSLKNIPKELLEYLAEIVIDDIAINMAKQLIQGEKKLILLGAFASSHPAFSQLLSLIKQIAKLVNAEWGVLTDGANSAGAWLAGCVPHREPAGETVQKEGLNTKAMFEQALKGYVLFNTEPELDCINGFSALKALQKAQSVIAITAFESPALLEYADILLPLCTFSESEGTFVNMEGQWQSFEPVVKPSGNARTGWKILRVLGNVFDLEGFEYQTAEEIKKDLQAQVLGKMSSVDRSTDVGADQGNRSHPNNLSSNVGADHRVRPNSQNKILRLAPVPLYAADGLVRRAKSLQATRDAGEAIVYLNQALGHRLKLTGNKVRVTQDDQSITLPFLIDNSIPDGCIKLDSGIRETIALDGSYSWVEIQNV